MSQPLKMFINGEWAGSSDGSTFEVFNPDDETVYAVVPSATLQDVQKAILAAYDVKNQWRQTRPGERAAILFRASLELASVSEEIAEILVMESGSTIQKARYEVKKTVDYIRARGEEIFRVRGETLPSPVEDKLSITILQPRGVVAAIAPWNFPLTLAMEKVASALACGNTVVLKPARETPCALLRMAGIFESSGLPRGVLNVITGIGGVIGDELIINPLISYINFTGSTFVGRHIAELAGRHLKKVTLELGGKNPLIVLSDADLDAASTAACYGGFYHSGQICMAVGRIIVDKKVAQVFTSKFLEKAKKIILKKGALFEQSTVLSPLINRSQLEAVKTHVKDAVEKGARLLLGGKSDGLYHEATVLSDVTRDMMIYSQETFGPVVPIIEISSVEEAIQVANDTSYGLSSGVFTSNITSAINIAEQLDAGMVHVNDSSFYADQECAPLGGVKDSGMGRAGSHYSIEEGMDVKWITIQKSPRNYPLWR